MLKLIIFSAALLSPAVAEATEYLTIAPVVVQAPGSAADLAKRAKSCAARVLRSGVQGGQVIVSADEGGVVASSAVDYSAGMVKWRLRSQVEIEARDGRARISQTAVERFNEMGGGWGPVGKWPGSGAGAAEAALLSVNDELAACLRAPAADW